MRMEVFVKNRMEFDWVDAFSNHAFAGNGCAVVYHAENWTLEERLSYVKETSLSECTFLSKEEDQWRVQYYLADREIPYAGHPTIASAFSLFHRGLIKQRAEILTGAGRIRIEIENNWVSIEAPIPQFKNNS